MGLVFLIVFGSVLGWLAAIIMRSEDRRGLMLNVALGIGGALLAGLVAPLLLGGGSLLEGHYSVDGVIAALFGALALLLTVNMLRDREVR